MDSCGLGSLPNVSVKVTVIKICLPYQNIILLTLLWYVCVCMTVSVDLSEMCFQNETMRQYEREWRWTSMIDLWSPDLNPIKLVWVWYIGVSEAENTLQIMFAALFDERQDPHPKRHCTNLCVNMRGNTQIIRERLCQINVFLLTNYFSLNICFQFVFRCKCSLRVIFCLCFIISYILYQIEQIQPCTGLYHFGHKNII